MAIASAVSIPIQSFESPDGLVGVDFRHAAHPDDTHSLEVNWRKPPDTDYFEAWKHLTHAEREKFEVGSPEAVEFGFWAGAAIVDPEYNIRADQDVPSFVSRLGHRFEYGSRPGPDEDSELRYGIFTYPSAARLNRTLDDVFGADDGGLRFEEHAGGQFSAIDSVRAFVMKGTVLVATEQPYEVHDLNAHALGFIGMGPRLVHLLRQRMGIYLERFDSGNENFNPPLPADTSRMDQINSYFHPARAVVVGSATVLDAVSERIFEETILRPSTYDLRVELKSILSSALGSITVRQPGSDTLSLNFLGMRGENLDAHALDILDRYEALSEALAK